jgi:hypothetical protein
MSSLTITHEIFAVGPAARTAFRMFLLQFSLTAGTPLKDISLVTPFRVFHIDAMLSGRDDSEQGYFVFTYMKETSRDEALGNVKELEQKIAELKAEFIHTFDLTPVTQG